MCVLVATVPAPAWSQSADASNASNGASDDGWHFSVAPYAWLAGLRGELSTIGLTQVGRARELYH